MRALKIHLSVMRKVPILLLRLSLSLLFLIVLLAGCNPFPKKDTHPELPYLIDLLKDSTKFKQIIGKDQFSELAFLKDDRILLKSGDSELPFKIIDIPGKVIIEQRFDWKMPFYLDQEGNLYFNKEKYQYPDYKKHAAFKTVVFKDSIDKKSEELGDQFADSVKFKMLDDYEIKLLQPYGLKPCEYQIVNTERCDVFEIRNNALLVRQEDRYKNDFAKLPAAAARFDEDVLIRWQNGRMVSPVYLAYYQVSQHKFKCDDMTLPQTIQLKGQNYLISNATGLFLIK